MEEGELKSLIAHLCRYGVISTLEWPAFIYDTAIKHWDNNCSEYLKLKGCENIVVHRVIINGDPTIYALCDSDMDFGSVKNYVERIYKCQNHDT